MTGVFLFMADCREQVYSDEFFDFIVSYEETNEQTIAGSCIQRIDEGYDIFYYPREGLPPLSILIQRFQSVMGCWIRLHLRCPVF